MRRSLWWTLGGTSALSLIALGMSSEPRIVLPARGGETGALQSNQSSARVKPEAVSAKPPLPTRLPVFDLRPAERDLFAPEEAKAAAKPASSAVAPTPPPPAPLPSMPYKVVGLVLDPDGRRLVVLGKSDKSVIATPGMKLDEGFVVESVGEEIVQLSYPERDVRFNLPIPRNSNP